MPPEGRRASDGSPYPDRTAPAFAREVREMFSHIARGYERFDHLASFGQDFVWRPRALWTVDRYRSGPPPRTILEVGAGTGEFCRLAARHYRGARVLGVDFTRAMLRRAASHGNGFRRAPDYATGDALGLPVATRSQDLALSAFLLRNLSNIGASFRELHRILRPGGTFLALEITEPTLRPFRKLFHAYFDHVVPTLGRAVGAEGPYRYLPESLRTLPSRDEMLRLLRDSGLVRTEAHPFSGGIVTAYLASAP